MNDRVYSERKFRIGEEGVVFGVFVSFEIFLEKPLKIFGE